MYIYLYMLFIILLESIHTEQIQKHETWAVEWRKSARPQDMFSFLKVQLIEFECRVFRTLCHAQDAARDMITTGQTRLSSTFT